MLKINNDFMTFQHKNRVIFIVGTLIYVFSYLLDFWRNLAKKLGFLSIFFGFGLLDFEVFGVILPIWKFRVRLKLRTKRWKIEDRR
jgi:hypothetical protein